MRHDIARGSLLVSLALLAGATPACLDGGRLPVCKTDADCAPKDDEVAAGPICYDLRCVQCRYDDDCEVGLICNGNLECERLSPKPPPDPDTKRKKPASWAKCAEACKDEACLQACEEGKDEPPPGEEQTDSPE